MNVITAFFCSFFSFILYGVDITLPTLMHSDQSDHGKYWSPPQKKTNLYSHLIYYHQSSRKIKPNLSTLALMLKEISYLYENAVHIGELGVEKIIFKASSDLILLHSKSPSAATQNLACVWVKSSGDAVHKEVINNALMIKVPECTMYVLGTGTRAHGQVFRSCERAETVRWPPTPSQQKRFCLHLSTQAAIFYALLSPVLWADSLPYQLKPTPERRHKITGFQKNPKAIEFMIDTKWCSSKCLNHFCVNSKIIKPENTICFLIITLKIFNKDLIFSSPLR